MSPNTTFPSATALTASSPVTSRMAEGSVLATLTSEQRRVNVVVVGVLVAIILVGLLGNALVVAVYRRRRGVASSTSPAILFILVMAGLDVVSCLLSVPYEILDLMKPYSNDNVPLCQACRFLTTAVSQTRGLMLLCVAWDRYLKICLPLTTYTYRHARVAVMAVLVLAVVLSWPQIPLNGHVTIHTHVPHVLATDCNLVRHLPAIYSLLYHGVLSLLFLVSFLMYGILYGRIFYVLWRNGWFESMCSSASGGQAQERGEPVGSQGTWKAVSGTQHRVRELEIRGLRHNEVDGVEVSHSGLPSRTDCRGTLCCQHRGSVRNTSLDEAASCHKMLKGSNVLCPCVRIVQETEKCKLTHQIHAVGYSRLREMSGSEKKLNDSFLITPSGFGTDGSAFNSSSSERNRTSPSSAQNSNAAQNSTNQPLCEILPGNHLGDFHCSKWFSSRRGYYKERHPRAVLACQPQSEDSIRGHSKCRDLHRSQSVPCCCLCEDTMSLPLLTYSDVHISLNSSPPAHRRAHFRTNIQEKFENVHSKLPIRLETVKRCSVSESDHKAWPSSKRGQLFKNHSFTSFLTWTGIHGTNSPSEKTELSKAPVVVHVSENTETLSSQPSASASISSGKDGVDFYENSPEPDLVYICNRPSTHPCIHREEGEQVLEDEALKEQVHHTIPNTDQNKMSHSSRRHSRQFLHGTSAAIRTAESAAIISTEKNFSQRLCVNNKRSNSTEPCPFHVENTGHTTQKHFLDENKEHTMQNQNFPHDNTKYATQEQQHFHVDGNTELSLGVPCTEHGDHSKSFVQDEKDCLKRNPENLQIAGAPHNLHHHAANPTENGGSGTSKFYLPEQNDFSQDRSPTLIKQSAHSTFIVTKNSPIGAARLKKNNPHEGLTATPDKRSGTDKIRRHGGKRLRMGKTTVMLALVTLSTVLCFVPFLTVIVMRTSGTRFHNQTSSTGDLVYMFCIRSFFLNNIVNPFVYFYVNPRFRQKVCGLLCRVGRWLLQLKLNPAQSVTSKSDT